MELNQNREALHEIEKAIMSETGKQRPDAAADARLRPTQSEIRERCLEIQERWDESDRAKREGKSIQPVETLEVSIVDLSSRR